MTVAVKFSLPAASVYSLQDSTKQKNNKTEWTIKTTEKQGKGLIYKGQISRE